MAMEGIKTLPPRSYVAGGTITANTLVTLNTSGYVIECGSGGTAVGVVYEGYSSGDTVPVYPIQGLHLVTASTTITAADFVKPAANGEVAPEAGVTTRTADTIGQAVESASGSGLFLAELGC